MIKKILLAGTTLVFIAGVAGEAQTKASPQKAAQEVIASCKKQYLDIFSEIFTRCIVAESYSHKSCIRPFQKNVSREKWVEDLGLCSKPIVDESIFVAQTLRFDEMNPFPNNKLKPYQIRHTESVFYSDKSIVAYQNEQHAKDNLQEMLVTKENADGLRREWCSYNYRVLGMPSQKVFDSCNRLFDKPTYSLNFATGKKKIVPAKPVNKKGLDPHQECLNARDYEGCMKFQANRSTATSDNCKPGKWCRAGAGNDILGQPKIEGWLMKSMPEKQAVGYLRPEPTKVLVRGETNRYIARERVIRYYQSPRAGTAPTTTTIGSGNTNCYDSGYSINCTTTPATTITTPSISARPGGIRQFTSTIIIDCKEKTVGSHRNNQLDGKWVKLSETPHVKLANKYCPIIGSLELSSFRKYAE